MSDNLTLKQLLIHICSDIGNYFAKKEELEKIVKDGTVVSANADYAEVGEWSDGNPDAEDRTGYFVSVDTSESGKKMIKASSVSDVRGVAIKRPAFAANASADKYDAEGNLLKQYDYVCFAGFAPIIDNGACIVNTRCMPTDDGTAVPSPNNMGYQVIERIDDTHVLVLVEPQADVMVRIKDDISQLSEDLDNLNSYVTPEMFGAVGDGETDDSEAFESIPSRSVVVGHAGRQYKVNCQINDNVVFIGCNFCSESSESKTNMIKTITGCKFFRCSFSSVSDKFPAVPDSEGGYASNVVALSASGEIYIYNCYFTNVYAMSLTNATAHISDCLLDDVEMGIYSELSKIYLSNSKIILGINAISTHYHGLYVPSFEVLEVLNVAFEQADTANNIGNLVHLYGTDTSLAFDKIAKFEGCSFKSYNVPFRSSSRVEVTGCSFDTTLTALNITLSSGLYVSTFNSCSFRNRSDSSSATTYIRVGSAGNFVFNDCLFELYACRIAYNRVKFNVCTFNALGNIYQSTDSMRREFNGCIFNLNNNTLYCNANVSTEKNIQYYINCIFDASSSIIYIVPYTKGAKAYFRNCVFYKQISNSLDSSVYEAYVTFGTDNEIIDS